MVRTQIQLPEEQVALLKKLAADHHTLMAEMISVSFETMRLLGIASAFTLDKHFKKQGFRCLPA